MTQFFLLHNTRFLRCIGYNYSQSREMFLNINCRNLKYVFSLKNNFFDEFETNENVEIVVNIQPKLKIYHFLQSYKKNY